MCQLKETTVGCFITGGRGGQMPVLGAPGPSLEVLAGF